MTRLTFHSPRRPDLGGRSRLAAALVALAACTPTPKHRLVVGAIVDGDRAKVTLAADAIAGLELRPIAVPPAPVEAPDAASSTVTRARASYVDGDFDRCRDELAKVDLGGLLAVGNRALAGRAIAFDSACAFGAQAKAEAEVLAGKLASLGLDLPDAPLAHDVETLINRAIERVGGSPRHPLAVRGEVGARLAIDGRPAGCTLPCTIDLPAGEHFVAVEADGFLPAARWVRVPDEAAIAVAQVPASAEVAAQQWRARIGRGLPAADAIGAKLLARLAGQPRLVYLHAGTTLAGTAIVEGEARATGSDDDARELVRELAYDAGILKRPAIYERPSFWIATSVLVAAVAGAIVYAVYEPEVESKVGF